MFKMYSYKFQIQLLYIHIMNRFEFRESIAIHFL
jgi:hypothetical protein